MDCLFGWYTEDFRKGVSEKTVKEIYKKKIEIPSISQISNF